jgi:hypothetical protein
MNVDVLEDALKHKHLGINVCPNGTWTDHINEIYKKATSTISLINNKNKRGSSMEPCGTPALMEFQVE